MVRPAVLSGFLLIFFAGGCATIRPIPPSDLAHCAIVAPLGVEHVLLPLRHDADAAFLVPVDGAGKLEMDRPIAHSYEKDGQVYFLDLPAGRYALAALSYRDRGLRFTARLTREESLSTVMQVRPGEAGFLGELALKRVWQGWGRFFGNGARALSWLVHPSRRPVAPIASFVKIHDRSLKAQARALSAARRDLAGTEWAAAVERKLKQINLAPERPMEGMIWDRRALPLHETARFSYVDTLEWGEPTPVKEGLEWRHPKEKARIRLRLVTGREAALRPLAAFLRELKEQGSPEDTHILREVVLSSRPASAVRYTTYHYPEPYLVGSVVRVSITETLVVEDPQGYFVLQFRCAREDFDRLYPDFARFSGYLSLKRGAPKEEEL
jgi:hypothetical protein